MFNYIVGHNWIGWTCCELPHDWAILMVSAFGHFMVRASWLVPGLFEHCTLLLCRIIYFVLPPLSEGGAVLLRRL